MTNHPVTRLIALAMLAVALTAGGCSDDSLAQPESPFSGDTQGAGTPVPEQAPVPSQTGMPRGRIIIVADGPTEISLAEAKGGLQGAGFPMRENTDQEVTRYILGAGQTDVRGVSLYQSGPVAARRGYVIAIEFRNPQIATELVKRLANQNRGEGVRFYVAGTIVVGYTPVPGGEDQSAAVETAARALATANAI